MVSLKYVKGLLHDGPGGIEWDVVGFQVPDVV